MIAFILCINQTFSRYTDLKQQVTQCESLSRGERENSTVTSRKPQFFMDWLLKKKQVLGFAQEGIRNSNSIPASIYYSRGLTRTVPLHCSVLPSNCFWIMQPLSQVCVTQLSLWFQGKILSTKEVGYFPSNAVKPCPCVSRISSVAPSLEPCKGPKRIR